MPADVCRRLAVDAWDDAHTCDAPASGEHQEAVAQGSHSTAQHNTSQHITSRHISPQHSTGITPQHSTGTSQERLWNIPSKQRNNPLQACVSLPPPGSRWQVRLSWTGRMFRAPLRPAVLTCVRTCTGHSSDLASDGQTPSEFRRANTGSLHRVQLGVGRPTDFTAMPQHVQPPRRSPRKSSRARLALATVVLVLAVPFALVLWLGDWHVQLERLMRKASPRQGSPADSPASPPPESGADASVGDWDVPVIKPPGRPQPLKVLRPHPAQPAQQQQPSNPNTEHQQQQQHGDIGSQADADRADAQAGALPIPAAQQRRPTSDATSDATSADHARDATTRVTGTTPSPAKRMTLVTFANQATLPFCDTILSAAAYNNTLVVLGWGDRMPDEQPDDSRRSNFSPYQSKLFAILSFLRTVDPDEHVLIHDAHDVHYQASAERLYSLFTNRRVPMSFCAEKRCHRAPSTGSTTNLDGSSSSDNVGPNSPRNTNMDNDDDNDAECEGFPESSVPKWAFTGHGPASGSHRHDPAYHYESPPPSFAADPSNLRIPPRFINPDIVEGRAGILSLLYDDLQWKFSAAKSARRDEFVPPGAVYRRHRRAADESVHFDDSASPAAIQNRASVLAADRDAELGRGILGKIYKSGKWGMSLDFHMRTCMTMTDSRADLVAYDLCAAAGAAGTSYASEMTPDAAFCGQVWKHRITGSVPALLHFPGQSGQWAEDFAGKAWWRRYGAVDRSHIVFMVPDKQAHRHQTVKLVPVSWQSVCQPFYGL
ncbi:hypothetical protein BC831DRAFT_474816 [Entophlyctis helioformis]|nr:hypothetical protein BC831DRAFT_474816 [Entophlyctis helioformis]